MPPGATGDTCCRACAAAMCSRCVHCLARALLLAVARALPRVRCFCLLRLHLLLEPGKKRSRDAGEEKERRPPWPISLTSAWMTQSRNRCHCRRSSKASARPTSSLSGRPGRKKERREGLVRGGTGTGGSGRRGPGSGRGRLEGGRRCDELGQGSHGGPATCSG